MKKVRLWCTQLSDQGPLKNRTEQIKTFNNSVNPGRHTDAIRFYQSLQLKYWQIRSIRVASDLDSAVMMASVKTEFPAAAFMTLRDKTSFITVHSSYREL